MRRKTSRKNHNASSHFILKNIKYDGVSYVYISWNQMGVYTFELAKKILYSEKTFDRVIALAKGGWTWTRTLVDYIQIDKISSIHMSSYVGVNRTVKPKILQPLTESVSGQHILLFDDVMDSGYTVKKVKTYLKSMGVESITVATLGYKPRSIIIPDFYAFESTAWIVFPHELREFITQSYATWKSKGISVKRIMDRFVKLGLPTNEVKYFLEIIDR